MVTESLTDTDLVDKIADLHEARASLTVLIVEAEADALQRLREKAGHTLAGNTADLNLVSGRTTYDLGTLHPLLEMLTEEEITTAWTPEHMEPVPAKWNGQQLNVIARKHGLNTPIGQRITDARIEGAGSLKLVQR